MDAWKGTSTVCAVTTTLSAELTSRCRLTALATEHGYHGVLSIQNIIHSKAVCGDGETETDIRDKEENKNNFNQVLQP